MGTKGVTRRRKPSGPTKAELAERVKELEAQVAAKTEKVPEPVQETETFTEGEQTEKVNKEAPEASAAEEKSDESRPLPASLQKRVDAMSAIYDDLQKEIEDFKSGQAYLEGDVPIMMKGLAGPGFEMGQRTLNWINPNWLDPVKHYRWSNKKMVDYHRGDGYKPTDFDEFARMVTARGGGHNYDKTPEGHVQSGDLILVETSKDWYKVLQERVRAKTARKERRAKGTLYQKGEQLGVEVYEGQQAIGPKMERLLRFLEKELGPGVVDAYLGAR